MTGPRLPHQESSHGGYNLTPLVDKALNWYKEKMAHICHDCSHYPDDCPPKRCPTHTSVKGGVPLAEEAKKWKKPVNI
jgi:hypothetical protein